jgi:hypothetical protein
VIAVAASFRVVHAVMNEAGHVRGVPGHEKRAAVVVGEGESSRASFGERETTR